jgi:hypothetical protein
MSANIELKKTELAKIVENRVIIGADPDTIPTRFGFIVNDGKLQCVWTRNLSLESRKKVIHSCTINKNGLTSGEWTELAEKLSDYL